MLSGTLATRVLERASEIDAQGGPPARVAELRAAALEAGISASAFDAALKEMQHAQQSAAARVPGMPIASRRRWLWGVTTGLVMFFIGGLLVTRMVAPPSSTAATTEEAFLLQCLSPADAAALVRPIISDASSSVRITDAAPNTITISATADRMARVQEVLATQDAASCALPPMPQPPPSPRPPAR